jgi:hypothetical protein
MCHPEKLDVTNEIRNGIKERDKPLIVLSMDSMIAALDAAASNANNLDTKLGENGHDEYSWKKNSSERLEEYRERIVQLNFQLVRSNDKRVNELCGLYEELMNDLNWAVLASNWDAEISNLWLLAYSLIGYVRDIIKGKGECTLSYGMICALIRSGRGLSGFDTIEAAKHAVNQWFLEYDFEKDSIQHPYGSWKDMKYLIKYMLDDAQPKLVPDSELEPMVTHLLQKTLEQIIIDEHHHKPSLCARWCPRENSKKFGFIFKWLAKRYFSSFIETGQQVLKKTDCMVPLINAQKKSFMEFRKILSGINKRLHTPQINQCGGDWASIDFDKNVTSITLAKQKRAFMNRLPSGGIKSWDTDRAECAINYREYIQNVVAGSAKAKGKRVSLESFTRDALTVFREETPEADRSILQKAIDSQWVSNSSTTSTLRDFIAMVDTSGSMTIDNFSPLYNAIALGIRIAEKSSLGKRIMTFSQEPTWINLESTLGFCNQARVVLETSRLAGTSTNFYKALQLILEACKQRKLSSSDVKNLVLVVLSDMQINTADKHRGPMMEVIKKEYANAGLEAVGEPWEVPTIVFWNLRSTDGFPAISNDNNAIMISGSSPVLVNDMASKGKDAIRDFTPWRALSGTLSSQRYSPMTKHFSMERLRSKIV